MAVVLALTLTSPSAQSPAPAPQSPAPAPQSPPSAAQSMVNCAPKPSLCGFPDATNSGVPSGVALKSVPGDVTSGPGWHWDERGWVVVDGDGATFTGYAVKAPIEVTGSNVTISNVQVILGGEQIGIGVEHTKNVTIENCTITAPDAGANRLLTGVKDVYGDAKGTVVKGNDISRTATGVQTHEGVIEDNYIHDLGYKPGAGDHTNGTTSNGDTTPLTIRHNTIFNPQDQTDAISLFQDFGVEANRLVQDNLLAGGGYAIYGGAGKDQSSNIRFTGNRISRIFYPKGGSYGPAAYFDSKGPGNAWTNNVWDDTNEQIAAP
ncbi:MAG: right-handed parallel beta-helix repeat-containing protein [Antricoccus sp.]